MHVIVAEPAAPLAVLAPLAVPALLAVPAPHAALLAVPAPHAAPLAAPLADPLHVLLAREPPVREPVPNYCSQDVNQTDTKTKINI